MFKPNIKMSEFDYQVNYCKGLASRKVILSRIKNAKDQGKSSLKINACLYLQ